jgi:uncharacterized protein
MNGAEPSPPGRMSERQRVLVRDVRDRRRYEARITEDGPLAGLLTYDRSPTWLALLHTEVQEGFEGLGIGSQLVAWVIADARAQGLAVVPRCPFVRRWLERHPDQQDVLAQPLPTRDAPADGRPEEPPEPA